MSQFDSAASGQFVVISQAVALLSLCVLIHALSLVTLGRVLLRRHATAQSKFSADLLVVISVTTVLVVVHVVEIGCWAALYLWKGCLPDFRTALYFSSVTYTTVGYGDVVLPMGVRGLSGAEALTGILLTGLSTGFLFAVLSRVFGARVSYAANETS